MTSELALDSRIDPRIKNARAGDYGREWIWATSSRAMCASR